MSNVNSTRSPKPQAVLQPQAEHLPEASEKAPRRPFLLSLMGDILALLTIIGWVRMGQAIATWNLQEELLGRPLAIYLVLSGALWGLCGLAVTILLLRRSRLAIRAAWAGVIFFPLTYWLERFFLVRSPQDQINWPFMLGLTLVWLALATIALRRRSTRVYLAKEQ